MVAHKFPLSTVAYVDWMACRMRVARLRHTFVLGGPGLPIRTIFTRNKLPTVMIVLKISNASEVVASKVGKFLERLTPDSIDHTTVEDQVIKKLIENLAAEGIKGQIAAINGLELEGENLSVHKGLNVRKHAAF